MTVFNENLIIETINMIRQQNFDIRTVTLAISLRDCISENVNTVCDKIQRKLDKYASNLVNYANEIENDYSIPIVNKRISVTPISFKASLKRVFLQTLIFFVFFTLVIVINEKHGGCRVF